MKKIISFITSIFILSTFAAPAFAVDSVRVERMEAKASKAAEIKQAKTEKMVEKLNDKAAREIDRRIASLKKLIVRLSSIKKLTDSQKSSFTLEIQAEITNLETLKAKIAADTDPAVLKADVQSIVKSYRVYALFMPKIEIIAAADRMMNTSDQVSSLGAKLKTRIDAAKTAGNDTTNLQTLLDDLNTKVADAKTQATSAINAVLPLTPDGYPGNTATLKSAREMLRVGHQDLMTAHHDAQSIIQGLHTLFKEKNGSSSGFMKPLKSETTPNP